MWRWRARHCTDGTLVALLDDELDPREQSEARRHLADCGRCSTRLQQQGEANIVLIGLLAGDHSIAQADARPGSEHRRHLSGGVAGAGILVASVGAIVAAGIVMHGRRRHTVAVLGNGRS
ncbi:MAG: zf-HC2 domain-containing protein [Dehalococcoidia bacterium]